MAALYKCRSELQVRNGKLQDVADVARDPRHAGKIVYGWVDGPMSCSCKEPDCWDKLKGWTRQTNPDSRPFPPMLPLPPLRPVPPLEPFPQPVWEPAPATPILPFIDPCMLNPILCFGQGGPA